VEINFNEVTRLHRNWHHMMRRCHNTADKQYRDYGGRGIYVVPEWQDFHNFCTWALANGAAPGRHLDRTNNDGPYGPNNCRYVTPLVNANNKRNNHKVTAFGETKTLAQWERDPRCVVKAYSIRRRLDSGWDTEEALTLKSAKQRRRRKCSEGHELTEENTYKRASGHLVCAICAKQRAKDRYWTNKQAETDLEH
jgi:hypothetical protein